MVKVLKIVTVKSNTVQLFDDYDKKIISVVFLYITKFNLYQKN